MPAVGLIVGGGASVAGGVGSFFGGKQQSQAAQSAANLQYQLGEQGLQSQQNEFNQSLQFATQSRDQQTAARNQALGLAQPSAAELAQTGINLQLQNQDMSQQMQALQRDQSILDAVDPAVKEAGNQALQLLQGKTAQSVQPALDQRNRQRTQLEQTLADRLGPDYASSSAGAAALRNFDNDTSTQMNGIQQQTLSQLLGVASGASNALNPVNQVANAYSSLGSLNSYGTQAAQNEVAQQVNAFTGNPVTQQLSYTPANYNPLIQAAGNSTIGAQMQGQNIGNLFNGLSSLGGQGIGYGLQSMNNQNLTNSLSSIFGNGSTAQPTSGYTGDLSSTGNYSLGNYKF